MNLRTLFTAALTLTATTAFSAEGTFDKSLNLQSAPSVSIRTGAGYVHVSSGSNSGIHIIGHVRIHPGWLDSDANADARVRQIVANPPIVQTGNIITIGPSHSDSNDDLYHNVSIDYDITTPRSTTLKAQTGSGGLQIYSIDGAVMAQTGSGGIEADGLGPNAHLDTGSGGIRASNIHGAATVQTGSGGIDLSLTAAGDVKAQTGSGSIHINALSGSVSARTGSGSIEVAGNPTSEWRLDSGSGNIQLKLTNPAHFTLYADTGSGSVHVQQPILMQGSLNPHHVTGTVNGGGPSVRASTGSGNVTLF